MKISPNKYAESLHLALEGKTKNDVRDIIARLLLILQENGDMEKAAKVIESFEKYWDMQNGLSVIEVTTAKEMDNDVRKAVKTYAKEMFKADEVEIKESLDPSILGGLILKNGDKVFDASVKARLYELKERIAR